MDKVSKQINWQSLYGLKNSTKIMEPNNLVILI